VGLGLVRVHPWVAVVVTTRVVSGAARQGRRKPPNGQEWKRDELWFAKFVGESDLGETNRQQSTGGIAPDVWRRRTNPDGSVSVTLVAEHKTTHSLDDWFAKAIRQEADNRKLYPGASSFIFITYHAPNRKVHRMAVRVVASDDEWTEDYADIPQEAAA